MAVSPPADRCGYHYDVSTLPGVGATVCWRPVFEEEDRCVWHARIEEKPIEALEALKPEAPERLDGAHVERCDFDGVDWFEDCGLIGATFVDSEVSGASFTGTDLREATFDGVDGHGAHFDGANLENARFADCDLRGAHLVGARLDQTVFANVRVSYATEFGDETVYERELPDAEDPEETGQAAIWAYHQLRTLHEENALAIKARRFRLAEKDVRRRVEWASGRYTSALWSEVSRWVTGYGLSPWRVLATGLVIVVLSAVLYPTTGGLVETIASGDDTGSITWSVESSEDRPRSFFVFVFFRSLYFSVITFTTVGYGDIRPVGDVARTIAGIEAVLGQALLALLVFVLSRRIT